VLLITSSLLITLLVSPYLYNYDFILLLVPFAVLVNSPGIVAKIVIALCYLVPSFAIVIYGRDGNITLNMVTIVLAFIIYLRLKRTGIDVPAYASYNVSN
jgi:hypothetical protein